MRPVFAAFAMVVAMSGAAIAEIPTLVQIESGKVQGAAGDGVISFTGIPYAQPPVGALRWRAPQSAVPWQDVLAASKFRTDCVQLPEKGTSEDCLYVNVWRPVAVGDKPLPVMVWIPGGGLIRGGASLYPFDNFARRGIVVVSLSYRLGRLGFFAHPALARETRGNYGYMDQIAGLKWVQRNIAAFGGDANNVTIAGESAGGGSVLVMLTSPLAQGLFQRTIVESAGIPSARAGAGPLRELAVAEAIAVDYARSVGANGDDMAALAKLRALPVETLSKGTEPEVVIAAIFGGPDVPGVANSIIDGLVVEPPETALYAGRHAMVPVISGANDMDLAITPAQTKEGLFALFDTLAVQARALYDPKGEASLKPLIQAIIADRVMVEPSRNAVALTAKAGEPAYHYRFSYVPEVQRGNLPGALHGAEIAFAFDAISPVLKGGTSAADLAMAQTMSGYWAAFVKTGDPNGEGRPEWPRYDPATGNVLNFTNTGVIFGADPLKARLDLWHSVWEQGR